MGKKLFAILMVAVVATFAGYNIYQSQRMETMSNLMLANVEALARYELPEVDVTCGSESGACWAASGDCYVSWFIRYDDCAFCGYTSYSCDSPCLH
ncbi:NVEALA domain-containing protein [Bacteroides sp. GD17]|jgi:hypothetical protein|uniref:NVEALA domain-containing protein n=1 Tax=Bacteroides sp. GD17 TaxID=3139826 RepID=UPI0025FDDC22|nr:NVEALA domain-containing protein [uncultured Bacteroides sp.]